MRHSPPAPPTLPLVCHAGHPMGLAETVPRSEGPPNAFAYVYTCGLCRLRVAVLRMLY